MEVPINVSLMIDKEDQCLKCKHFVCDLTDIPGFFLNFDIQCVNKYTKFAAKTCFMFRVIGSFTTNESLPTISTSTKMVEMSTTITTATATITTTAMSTNATTMKLTSTLIKVQNNSTKATAKKMQTSTVIGTSTRHVSFSVKTKKSKANKKMNHNLAIFSAVGVVVIVLLLFVVLLIFYKRKKQVQSEKGCYVNEQASAGVGNENNGPVYSEMNDLLKSKTCEADVSMMKISEETDSDELSTMENPYYMPTQCHNEFSNANCKENNIYNYACNGFSGNVKITAPSAHVTMSKSPEYTYITPVTSSNNPMYDVASFESMDTATVCSNSGDKTAVNEVYGI
ncbi:uncharacterized protein LOC130626201 isoform X2 [Hydractinia symbiolongicarpus]|nr:uncharacterized protein LOC130626201 isoform X2 [Hydractinia symbiolongicarpus]